MAVVADVSDRSISDLPNWVASSFSARPTWASSMTDSTLLVEAGENI